MAALDAGRGVFRLDARQWREGLKALLSGRVQVPRLVPAISPRVADSGAQPAWGLAFLGELYFWGVAVSFAVLGWRYNSLLITQGVLISLGLSLVARAFIPRREPVSAS